MLEFLLGASLKDNQFDLLVWLLLSLLSLYSYSKALKDVHRRQKLTTYFSQTF